MTRDKLRNRIPGHAPSCSLLFSNVKRYPPRVQHRLIVLALAAAHLTACGQSSTPAFVHDYGTGTTDQHGHDLERELKVPTAAATSVTRQAPSH